MWVFPSFSTHVTFLLQDPAQVTTWQEIIVTPWSPPPTCVSSCLPLAFMTSKVYTSEVKFLRVLFCFFSFVTICNHFLNQYCSNSLM